MSTKERRMGEYLRAWLDEAIAEEVLALSVDLDTDSPVQYLRQQAQERLEALAVLRVLFDLQ